MLALPPYVTVWLILVLAWATNFIIRIGFSALLPPIMAELGLSYTRAGMLACAFFWATAATRESRARAACGRSGKDGTATASAAFSASMPGVCDRDRHLGP